MEVNLLREINRLRAARRQLRLGLAKKLFTTETQRSQRKDVFCHGHTQTHTDNSHRKRTLCFCLNLSVSVRVGLWPIQFQVIIS